MRHLVDLGLCELAADEARVRALTRREVADTVSAELATPKAMADAQNRYDNEQRAIDYVVVDRGKAGEVAAPTLNAERHLLVSLFNPTFLPFLASMCVFLLGMGIVNPLGTAQALSPFGEKAGAASALAAVEGRDAQAVQEPLARRRRASRGGWCSSSRPCIASSSR